MSDKPNNNEPYIKIPEWLARRKDLTWLEKALISQIERYGKSGNFQSNATLASTLGVDRSHMIRTLHKLISDKRWVAPLYESSQRRILYANMEKIRDEEPLLDGCGKPVKSSAAAPQNPSATGGAAPPVGAVKSDTTGGAAPPVGVAKSHTTGGAAPPVGVAQSHTTGGAILQRRLRNPTGGCRIAQPVFNRNIVQSSIVHFKEDSRVQGEICFASSAIGEGDAGGGLTRYERNKRTNQLKSQVEQMLAEK